MDDRLLNPGDETRGRKPAFVADSRAGRERAVVARGVVPSQSPAPTNQDLDPQGRDTGVEGRLEAGAVVMDGRLLNPGEVSR